MNPERTRVCPECGGDRWKARHAEQDFKRAEQLRIQAEAIAKQNGLLTFKLDMALRETRTIQGLMQRKIIRQARVINRLEKRLRELNQKPYEGAKLSETAPGSEWDATQRLPNE